MNVRIPLAAAMAALLLAGCKQASTGQSEAPAEVLSGSISDAMLPYDAVTSQPPLDPRAVRTARAGEAEPDDLATDVAPGTAAAIAPAPGSGTAE